MESPNQALAKLIMDRLVKEKLLSDKDGKKLEPLLASGKLKADDWRLALETMPAAEKP